MKNTPEKTRTLDFLRRHVIGKYVVADPVTTQIDNNRIAAAYEEDAVYSNLVETAQGFSFDLTTMVRGTRYIRGDKLLAEGTMNAVRVIRYDITERLSSGDLLGHARFISSTNSEPDPFAGTIFLVRLKLHDGVLNIEEKHVGYADEMSAEGKFIPIATDGKYQYSVEDGRLIVKYQQETFNVDPESFKRTPTGTKFPVQVNCEISFPVELNLA